MKKLNNKETNRIFGGFQCCCAWNDKDIYAGETNTREECEKHCYKEYDLPIRILKKNEICDDGGDDFAHEYEKSDNIISLSGDSF